MAEAALFSLAGKLLAELASPGFEKAYQRVQSIRKAKEDLDKLTHTIGIIQAVLLDAEKKHEESAAVTEWIQRVRDVLYDADDLFDDVATDALLKQQQPEKETMLSKVRASFSNKFNAINSDDNIAKKVKAIRKRLDEISTDMARLHFMPSQCENQMSSLRKRAETSPYLNEKVVIGRDDEKNAILESLFDMSGDEQSVSVIGIVGIGGMGKTVLAQLIYNHEEVQRKFENKWWACISDVVGETTILERIARSMNKDSCHDSDPKEQISRSVKMGSSYLLVLDDVWDNDLRIWVDIMSLLTSGTKESKIIVTTRSESVPRALQKGNYKIHKLNGLSNEKSWELFKKIAFTKKQVNDPRWISLGMEIMEKCANVPLAITSIASLLLEKNTIREWESFKDQELSKIKLSGDSVMSTLKLSYDHLPSHLKHCFAYCSLFPQDYIYHKEDLVSQWIAQGYVEYNDNETLEEAGHSYFMELFRKSFFQEAEQDELGEIKSCKMHDLIHDLAKEVAGKESLTLTTGWNQFSENARHLYVCCNTYDCRNIPHSLLDANRLRSCFFKAELSLNQQILDGLLTNLKLLRSLNLSDQRLENVPCSIGDLKHLRYLNLSWNKFTSLPDSFTKLVNLLTLDISYCPLLNLPNDFRKLINLRHLYNKNSFRARIPMPPGFRELTSLQRLNYFMVGKKADCSSRLDVLARLRLKGQLLIAFEQGIEDWDEDERWQLPTTLQVLQIDDYPGRRIPHWELGTPCNLLPNLVSIEIYFSSTIEHLPPLRWLPYLKILQLRGLPRLKYVEEKEDENEASGHGHSTFFPCLEFLHLWDLPILKGWSRKLEAATTKTARGIIVAVEDQRNHPSFPLLSELKISKCKGLKSMPLCPHLRTLTGEEMSEKLMQQLLSASSCSSLETVEFWSMKMLSFSGHTLTSLRRLRIGLCNNLKHLNLAPCHLNVLEELNLRDCCSKLELWEEYKRGVEWDSLPNLRKLVVRTLPARLPDSLQKLVDAGQLQVSHW